MPDFAPGDQVIGVTGRLHGSKAVVLAVGRVDTPSGSSVTLVKVMRPRAGEAYAFPHELRHVEEPKPAIEPAQEGLFDG